MLYVGAKEFLEDSFELGARVLESGFRPSIIVAIWRGGAPVGMAVQELLDYFGVEADHIAIRASSYSGIDDRASEVRVLGLDYLLKHIERDDRLLIVDDVVDTGRTIETVIGMLREKARRNAPREIRVAVPFYKPSRNLTTRVPDYYLHETDRWIKFPHSLEGLTKEQIRRHRPALHAVLREASPGAGASGPEARE